MYRLDGLVLEAYTGAMQGRPSKRESILDAASRVVESQGAAHLTIDAVAAEAAVSKGGVLYHFPSKQALLEGMLERVLAAAEQDIQASGSPYGGVHAHALAFTKPLSRSDESAALAILAASAEDPQLLDSARTFIRDSIDALRGSDHFADALMVLVALEGQRIMDALGLLPLNTKERKLLTATLLQRAEEASR